MLWVVPQTVSSGWCAIVELFQQFGTLFNGPLFLLALYVCIFKLLLTTAAFHLVAE